MKIVTLALSSALLLAPLANANSAIPSVVAGRALFEQCATIQPDAIASLSMVATDLAIPISRWRVVVAINVCGANAAALCDGEGNLGTGVTIGNCLPDGSGSLAPVVVCIPGPAREVPPIVSGHARFNFASSSASFSAPINLTIAGAAADEAQNICV